MKMFGFIVLVISAFFRPSLDNFDPWGDAANQGIDMMPIDPMQGGGSGLDMLGGALGIGQGLNTIRIADQAFQPTGMKAADQWWQQIMPLLMSRQQGIPGQIDPQLLASYMKMLGIDTGPLTAAGAGAGTEFGALAGQGTQYAGQLGQAGTAALGRGDQLWQNASDPMNAQHDFARHGVLENVRGAESARGIAMGNQGAGLEADALGKFDIDWKNFQDNRMLQANQGANISGVAAGQNFGESMNIGSAVPGYTMASGQVPFGAQVTAAQFPAQAATSYAGNVSGTDPFAAILNQLSQYMGNTFGKFGNSPQQQSDQSSSGFDQLASALPALASFL